MRDRAQLCNDEKSLDKLVDASQREESMGGTFVSDVDDVKSRLCAMHLKYPSFGSVHSDTGASSGALSFV